MKREIPSKILVANRGEIALRVMRTCREMGITTVAVYSDADRSAPHVRFADEAVHIGGAEATASYLDGERILAVARRMGAQAIHPGYGFLSESAAFAKACAVAGVNFIGPSPSAMERTGDKAAAKAAAGKAGVPTVPGYQGSDQSTKNLDGRAREVGFPLLVKASAGGGGKGMRLVRDAKELSGALDGARREAERAFGRGDLILEKYLEGARHIEVQIFGDTHGHIIHLFERDCSLQRRHQKIVEESPSPAVNDALRKKLGEAAVKVAKIIGYDNAGTVEFLVTPNGEFYFLEVNARLQVEHPVTEALTGLDLVKMQIEVAGGMPLPLTQEGVTRSGHAIEARLYAESPERHFAPAAGRVLRWVLPPETAGLRVDAGVAEGEAVSIHYDPMLAKIIAHGPDRESALRKLGWALEKLTVQGLKTNRDFLIRLLRDERVKRGEVSTTFVETHLAELLGKSEGAKVVEAAVVASLHAWTQLAAGRRFLPALPVGFRNNPFRYPTFELEVGEEILSVSYYVGREGKFHLFCKGETFEATIESFGAGPLEVSLNGVRKRYEVVSDGEAVHVASGALSVALKRRTRFPASARSGSEKGIRAPMTGRVTRVFATSGQKVKEGEPLLVLEAMKMEQTVHAHRAGTLGEILVKEGDTVEAGIALFEMGEETART